MKVMEELDFSPKNSIEKSSVIADSTLQNRTIHEVIIEAKYLEFIKNSQKTVEGRVNKPKYTHIQRGDIIEFVSSTHPATKTFCLVMERAFYPNFRTMLESEGVKNCLPDSKTIDDGVEIYHGFPGYASDEIIYRVVAFKIKLLKERIS